MQFGASVGLVSNKAITAPGQLRHGVTLTKGGVVGPYPAPSGYRWDYVTENNIRVTEAGTPVVALRAA
jgi:hypothetical protein